jgi:hypothetical protein
MRADDAVTETVTGGGASGQDIELPIQEAMP